MSILVVDAASDGVSAGLVDLDGARVLAVAHRDVAAHAGTYGREQAPDEVWRAVLELVQEVLQEVVEQVGREHPGGAPTRIALASHGGAVLWDVETLGSPRHALADPARSPREWLVEVAAHEPHTWALVAEGRYAVGTLESYLLARMTRGTWQATDASHAHRTGLLDRAAHDWDARRTTALGIPTPSLPDVLASWGTAVPTEPRAFAGLALPVTAMVVRDAAAAVGIAGGATSPTLHLDGAATLCVPSPGSPAPDGALVAHRSPAGATTYAAVATLAVDGDLPAAVASLLAGLVPDARPDRVLRVGGPGADDARCRALAEHLGHEVVRPAVPHPVLVGAATLAGLSVDTPLGDVPAPAGDRFRPDGRDQRAPRSTAGGD